MDIGFLGLAIVLHLTAVLTGVSGAVVVRIVLLACVRFIK